MDGADTVVEIQVPGQRIQPSSGRVFPLVLGPSSLSPSSTSPPSPPPPLSLSTFTSWIKENVPLIEEKLIEHGVVMMRGFPLSSAQDFLECMNAFGWEYGSYLGGGGPRNQVLGPIHTSTETPADFFINFHHELAYLPSYPSRLFFFCETPPAQDGETPLLHSHTLLRALERANPAFIERIREKGVRYTSNIDDANACERKYQRGWQEIYDTSDRDVAAQRAMERGKERVEWVEGNRMRNTSVRMEGVRMDTRRNVEVFFNSIVLLHPATQRWLGKPPTTDTLKRDTSNAKFHVTYGDFSEISDEDVLSALDIMHQEKVVLKWERGDVVIVDNNLAMHARNTFTPPRRILTAIVK